MESTVEIFDVNTVWNRRGKPPLVRMESGRNCRINFSVEAVKLLGLKEGMKLSFRVHSNDNEAVYFYEHKNGIPLKFQYEGKSGKRLAIYCRPLAKKILGHFGYKVDKHKSFLLSNATTNVDGVPMWFIDKENLHTPVKLK